MPTIKLIAPSSAYPYWLGAALNNKYAEGQPGVVFGPGIGESGQRLNLQFAGHDYGYTNQGSQEATGIVLNRVNTWGSSSSMSNAADFFGFNIITMSAKHEYDFGEYQTAILYARDILKASKITLIVNSLGGYGLLEQLTEDAQLASMIDVILWIVPGPGAHTISNEQIIAKRLAAAGVKNWFLTVENDVASGTSPTVAINMHKTILSYGGSSFLTVYKSGIWTDSDAHQLYFRAIPAWYQTKAPGNYTLKQYATTATPLGQTGIKNIVVNPNISIYNFLINGMSPDGISTPPPTTSTTTSTTTTQKSKIMTINGINLMGDDVQKAHSIVDVQWIDENGNKENERFDSSGPNGRLQGVWVTIQKGQLIADLNYKDANLSVVVGPTKTV